MDDKIELEIVGLTYSEHFQPTYILILKEKNGPRRLPIAIGHFEAQAIGMKLENLVPKRPITHDLMTNILKELGANLIEVNIVKVEEDIFFGEIVIEQNGVVYKIDSRPSDAIALAVRFNCPIYANRKVMDEVGIDLEKLYRQDKLKETSQTEDFEQPRRPQSEEEYLRSLSIEDLEKLMQDAIEKENYEFASKIRDEIKRRKGEL